jgi:hypothetical protein
VIAVNSIWFSVCTHERIPVPPNGVIFREELRTWNSQAGPKWPMGLPNPSIDGRVNPIPLGLEGLVRIIDRNKEEIEEPSVLSEV